MNTNLMGDRYLDYSKDIDKSSFHDLATDIKDLRKPLARNLDTQKQHRIVNDRSKKRVFKHFGSAKNTDRKTRSLAMTRRVASGPAKMDDSSSSSMESTEYETSCLISAPEPAPSDPVTLMYIYDDKETSFTSDHEVTKIVKPNYTRSIIKPNISSSSGYINSDAANLLENINLDTSQSTCRSRSSSVPRPLNIPITSNYTAESGTLSESTSLLMANARSPCFSPKSLRSPYSPRSPLTRKHSPRIPIRTPSSPRYQMNSQLSPLPTIRHSPNQSSVGSSSASDRIQEEMSNQTLQSPNSPRTTTNNDDRILHSYNTSSNPTTFRTGHLAMLASRRKSAAARCGGEVNRGRRTSNFLELPGKLLILCLHVD